MPIKPSFWCCCCGKEPTKEQGIQGKLKLGGTFGFIGLCVICGHESEFLSCPPPIELVMQNIEDFGDPIPKACSACGSQNVERWGLNMKCLGCNRITSAADMVKTARV